MSALDDALAELAEARKGTDPSWHVQQTAAPPADGEPSDWRNPVNGARERLARAEYEVGRLQNPNVRQG